MYFGNIGEFGNLAKVSSVQPGEELVNSRAGGTGAAAHDVTFASDRVHVSTPKL